MTVHRLRSMIVAFVFALATVGTLGPHMMMLGYKLAGARPPAELLLFCPLHRLDASHEGSSWTLSAKPLRGARG
jgi:hypothetical protein